MLNIKSYKNDKQINEDEIKIKGSLKIEII